MLCSNAGLSARNFSVSLMSELPDGDTHDVIARGEEVVAVVVPLAEYRRLRRALEEQQVNEELDAAQLDFLRRQSAGALCYVSHEEAGRRLGPARPVSYQVDWEVQALARTAGLMNVGS
jgi:hypothetical protein